MRNVTCYTVLGVLVWLTNLIVPHAASAQEPTTSGTLPRSGAVANSLSGQSLNPAFFVSPTATTSLPTAFALIPEDAHALVLLDARLHALIAPELHDYIRAAAARRQFRITVLPMARLDDCRPEEVRAALQGWHAARPALEGVLFIGNIKLPSFFMPRVDIHSTRLWPRFFEDLDMTPTRTIPPGKVLKDDSETKQNWPNVAGVKSRAVGGHDYDFLVDGKSPGPELWAAFLPVGLQKDAENGYPQWASQLKLFFKKAAAFHQGTTVYGRGLYLVSNDNGLMARSRPVWEAIGPGAIEFFALNEKGPGTFKNNPAGYQRAPLEKYASLDEFLAYAKTRPWMD